MGDQYLRSTADGFVEAKGKESNGNLQCMN
jgi:hypothetical protein